MKFQLSKSRSQNRNISSILKIFSLVFAWVSLRHILEGKVFDVKILVSITFFTFLLREMMIRTQTIAAALAVLCAGIDTANGFTTPSSLIATRAWTGSNVRLVPKSPASKSTLYMSAEVAAEPESEDSDDKLFEGFGKGIKRDFKARLPFFKSDITDGLNAQVSRDSNVK
jgi:hypothetical protein